MKFLKFILAILIFQPFVIRMLYAGDVAIGSVPNEITYQGRLEKDNAPITGPVHLTFRIYDALTGGNLEYESPEILVNAVQGIFTASFAPPWSVFSSNEERYLEIQIESDILSPREQIKSVVYSLVSKRLEDGSNIEISSMTATGEIAVNNNIKITGALSAIYFPDGSVMNSANVGSQGNISNPGNAIVTSDNDDNASGDIIFMTGTNASDEKMRITDAGNVGIGVITPLGKLDVDGSLFLGNEGIYDRDDGEVNIKENLIVEGGKIIGANSEYISLGETNDIINFFSGGSERMRVHSNGNVGIGISAPNQPLDVSGNIHSDAGIMGGNVTIGNYGAGNANEIRTASGDLLIQQTSNGKVGVGTSSPSEKLDVEGSVKASKGIIASTAAFSSDVTILGDFTANNPLGSNVELSSTVIYGTLQVTGAVGSNQGYPAYLISTQTFSGQNTFINMVKVSSEVVISKRLGVGIGDTFNFAGDKYLQIGDNIPAFANDDASAYIVAGANANSKIHFYRGLAESARLETQGDKNLALLVDGSLKSLATSATYYIYNSAFYVSTSPSANPGIYMSPSDGNVSIGTTISDPNWKLTVDGNLRLNSGALIFPDGSSMASSSATSANSISNNTDALILGDADTDGSGGIMMKVGGYEAIYVNSGGNVGVGTLNPSAKLEVRGGDVILGNAYNPYSANGVEDLIVAGSLVLDGGFLQRSATPVELSALTVSGDVYLSTSATARTGIGNDNPGYRLDVTDDINASGNIRTGGIARISNTGIVGSGGANATWDGNTIAVNRGGTGATSFTSGGILYGDGTSAIKALPQMGNGGLIIGGPSGSLSTGTITGTNITVSNGPGTIGISIPQSVATAATPTFAGITLSGLTGMLKGNGAGAVTNITGTQNRLTRWSDNNTIGASSVLTDDGSRFGVNAPIDISQGLTASSGTFLATGANQYSIRTSSGIYIADGNLRIPDGALDNYVLMTDDSGNARWGDPSTSGFGDNVIGNEVKDAADLTLTRSGGGTSGNPYELALNLGNANTWTAVQTFNGGMSGDGSGLLNISSVAVAGFYDSNAVRANLGLAIGTNVQAYDADLDDLADGTLTGSKVGSGVPAANIASGSLGSGVIASSIAVGAINNENQIVDGTITDADLAGSISPSKITGTAAILGANTFTGAQTLPSDPTSPLQAATKQYVDSWSRPCVNPNDTNDIMVPVGSWCVDKYEASVWSSATGGAQYGSSSDDYPCNDNGQDCGSGAANPIYARSVSGVTPSRYITWFQANIACFNSGKELLPNHVWQAAAAGTVDPGSTGAPPDCNVSGSGPTTTGSGGNCLSTAGAENMIGSLWEWVADWGTSGAGTSAAYGTKVEVDLTLSGYNDDGQWNIGGYSYTNYGSFGWIQGQVPAVFRGGHWLNGADAGVFAFNADYGASLWASGIGFRCGRRR